MEKPLGIPKKGAVSRLRELYNKRRKQPSPIEDRKRLREIFKKDEQASEKPKRIAKPKSDLELP
jgi:hypothetical protein